jgi:hypothetical protein
MPPPQDPQRSSPDSGRFGWRDFGPRRDGSFAQLLVVITKEI